MNYYIQIKDKLLECEIYDKAKDYSKDRNKVNTYYEIGKLLSDAGKEYGKNIIKQYSEKLMIEVGKKYNVRTLYGMRKFYEIFSNEKLNPMGSKLSWSHYRELLVVKDINAIKYYIDISNKNNLTKRQLQEKIKTHEYDRLTDNTKKKLEEQQKLKFVDLIPNPIILKVNNINEKLTEYALIQVIINNLDKFLF